MSSSSKRTASKTSLPPLAAPLSASLPAPQPLAPEVLCTRCDLEALPFATTDDLEDLFEFIGQDRASKAIDFGVRMRRQGYNIFALGPAGSGKLSLTRQTIEQAAAAEAPPSDWCYVNDFDQPATPKALKLPAGKGKQLRADMQRLSEDLRTGLSRAFESEEVQTRRQHVADEFQERQQASLTELQEKARVRNLALLRTPAGLAFAPLKDGSVLPPEEFEKLSAEEQDKVKTEVEQLQVDLQRVIHKVPAWERELRTRIRELTQEITSVVLRDVMDDLFERYTDLQGVLDYLQAVQKDVIEHVTDFLSSGEKEEGKEDTETAPLLFDGKTAPRRYQVNVLVDAAGATGAPVVHESNPTFLNLIGRVEQMAQMGALVTDFMLIKPGALHRANGGYLILDALRLLTTPYAWEGLKRALQFREIRIESAQQLLSLTSTVSLEPMPIPLDVKVVLLGDRELYYLLSAHDPDFSELFKVSADFEEELPRTTANQLLYARLIATIARREQLRPFDRTAVGRIIEHSARTVEDAERLTARMNVIEDLMQEADHWAADAKAELVAAAHVQAAIAAQINRANRIEERMREQIVRGTMLIDSEGAKVGQINGLSVIGLGNYSFGRPSRITATIRMGNGELVDIEREVEMGGPIHTKGVLILSSFLRSRYALDRPLSLAASLVFEQSYGGIDGDSASSTELYVLLSAISGVPIKQSLAVTGSVNQLGQVQAIGGVNEKVEGWFDLCAGRGLTGEHGVLIPATNVKHLMLKDAVVDAVTAGKFRIFAVETIDQGIELLTGVEAGAPDAQGVYPEGSINRRVADRLMDFSEMRKRIESEFDKKRTGNKPPSRRRSWGDGL